MAKNFRNMLDYRFAPSEFEPDVVTEPDLRRFLAYGFLLCFDHLHGLGTELLAPEIDSAYRLRKNFLETVKIAKNNVPDMESGDYTGDQDSGGIIVVNLDGPKLVYEWIFSGYEVDENGGTVRIDLRRTEDSGKVDQVAVWLNVKALSGNRAGAVIADAMALNEDNKETVFESGAENIA